MLGPEGWIHLLFAGFISILWRVVKVIADTTALHTSPILHEVAFCAIYAPISTCPLKARQMQATETKPQKRLHDRLLLAQFMKMPLICCNFKSYNSIFVLFLTFFGVPPTSHFKLNPFAKNITPFGKSKRYPWGS